MFGADKGKADRLDGKDLCIGIVQARFNEGITNALAEACRSELLPRWACSTSTSTTCWCPARWRCRWRCRRWPRRAATTR